MHEGHATAHGYAAGSSPFKFKGTGYKSQFDYLDQHVLGGAAAVIARIEDPATRAFLERQFLSGGWYDVLPVASVVDAAALHVGITNTEMCRRFGRWTAQRDIPGVYRMLLSFASPEGLVRRFPKSSKLYFNFVDLEVHELRPKVFEIVHDVVPRPIVHVYQYSIEAFRLKALTSAGAHDVKTRWLPPEPHSVQSGLELVRLRCELSWE